MLDRAIHTGFIKPQHRELTVVEERAEALLDRLAVHELPAVRKWLDLEET